ncbi:hypothetical protein Pedsa_0978 [Pseudopedobacter saltans DSM 12145]|uniref:Uncharacterized protein n=1 Tax=Pseudopedobacter saltans (strain ATCC 51119 / DSM 12145 / JCM 21818 / CCUG 39354 / LMG 10337 / NBRC 100064 / NCIMB 13643) TaxID=762903 RepID=F0SAV4_PSESL|nr:hypothetical protein [Pseudopedobacter saltans]ADY51549.1 hypothetical protein Pedsa_0978 [Pseudopedobacter saltans DSM 12145]
MNKSSKKRNSYNPVAIDHVAKQFGYSKTYIRWCIDGTKAGIMPDEVKKAYNEAVVKIEEALSNHKR